MDCWRQSATHRGFSGREWFFARLEAWLEEPGSDIWVIEAEPGFGKTFLAREIARRYPGVPVLGPESSAEADEAPWLVIDAAERQTRRLGEAGLLGLEQYSGKQLIFSRPCLALARIRRSHTRWDRYHGLQVDNLQDLATFLAAFPQPDSVLRSSAGNFGLAQLLLSGPGEIDVYRHFQQMVEDVLIDAPHRDLSVQILTLLGETGGDLEMWRICDFLGSSAMRVRQALQAIEPLLWRQADSYRIFNPWLSRSLSWAHFRDLEIIHASIITYFRETYPSWEEMSDSYGWDYLVHHCDRFARTGRKRDYSVLHWLGEGPFLRQKLRQGGKLPGVLRDLERCLRAAMEEEDLSRIAFYAFQIPRIRQERLAPEMHRLADMGQLETAARYAELIPREPHRQLALVVLAWQASDEHDFARADHLLTQAFQLDVDGVFPEINLLLVSICACLLRTLPHREKDILEFLSRDEETGRAASNYLTLGLIGGLEDRLRNWVLRRGWSQAPRGSAPDQQRLSTFIGQSLRALKQHQLSQVWSGVLARPELTREDFDQRLKDIAAIENEVERLDQLVDLADQVARQNPPEWLNYAVGIVTQSVQGMQQPDCRLRAFAQLSRIWLTLGSIPEAFDGLERLSHLSQELELENQLRVRIVADLALGFHRLGDASRSQQLISRAAAGAVSEVELGPKASALAFVAAATAQMGHPARARDLAFTLLEVIEPPPGPQQDHFCRLTFRLASSAANSPDQLRQALSQDQREIVGLGNSPRERAYMLLGLARAAFQGGDQEWPLQLLDQAAAYAHQLVVPKLRAATLADLACLCWDMGLHERYATSLKEAEEALEAEQSSIQRSEGQVEICRALAHSKNRLARLRHRQLLEELSQLDRMELCLSPTLPRLWPLLQEEETRQLARQLLDSLRQGAASLEGRDRDFYQAGLIQLELAFHDYDRALSALQPIRNLKVRSQALVDLAAGLTRRDPLEGLQWLPVISRQHDRLRAIRQILAEIGNEKRPWKAAACLEALRQLTFLAHEDEATTDLAVSYWLTREADLRKFEETGKRMGWTYEVALQSFTPPPA